MNNIQVKYFLIDKTSKRTVCGALNKLTAPLCHTRENLLQKGLQLRPESAQKRHTDLPDTFFGTDGFL